MSDVIPDIEEYKALSAVVKVTKENIHAVPHTTIMKTLQQNFNALQLYNMSDHDMRTALSVGLIHGKEK